MFEWASLAILTMALSIGFIRFVSSSDAHRQSDVRRQLKDVAEWAKHSCHPNYHLFGWRHSSLGSWWQSTWIRAAAFLGNSLQVNRGPKTLRISIGPINIAFSTTLLRQDLVESKTI
jgi:hypothetical protein